MMKNKKVEKKSKNAKKTFFNFFNCRAFHLLHYKFLFSAILMILVVTYDCDDAVSSTNGGGGVAPVHSKQDGELTQNAAQADQQECEQDMV